MQPSTPAAAETTPLACDACGTKNVASARFCKHCGGSLVPPATCPACRAEVANDARFCSSCGAKLVGARPGRTASPLAVAAASTSASASTPASQVASASPGPQNRKKPSSNVVANVLMFVAALAVFVAIMYAVNKDAPKSESPFNAPPASQMMNRMQEQPNTAAQTVESAKGGQESAAVASIKGTIKVASGIAPPPGTLFISLRNAGMPAAGPPVAVKRIDRPTFPVDFEIGPENVMMPGVPFTGPFSVSVKLSQSGNAMAPEPGDLALSAPKGPVKPGDSSVEIVLDKRL
jgi:double zinc ribbon protein